LELTKNGASGIDLGNDKSLTFVEDGDSIVLSGHGTTADGKLIGFGNCVCPVSK
jgi:hypothetical protein